MSEVTPEVLDSVAEWFMRGGGTESGRELADRIRKSAAFLRIETDADHGLAQVIRNSYYDDGEFRPLSTSRDPAVKSRVPRVFCVGDAEPEDRDTIVLRGEHGEELRFGHYAKIDVGRDNPREWWWVNQLFPTHATWNYWLANCGQLTEVVDGRKPRVFHDGDEIPADVNEVITADDGSTAVRTGNGGWWYVADDFERAKAAAGKGWDYFGPEEFPLTEVVSGGVEEPKTRDPRVFTEGDVEPSDLTSFVDADGDRYERTVSEWTTNDGAFIETFEYIVGHYGPLTEVGE